MSHISCILCGLQRPISKFDPSNYDNEIYLITKKSKGRGKGFDDDVEPILGDDTYTPIIKDRILEIVRIFLEKKIISKDEVVGLVSEEDETELIPKEFLVNLEKFRLNKQLNDAKSRERDLTSKLNMKEYEINKKEFEKREISDKYDKMKIENENLIELNNQMRENIISSIKSKINLIDKKDLLDYALKHLLKYCEAGIQGLHMYDFKVYLKKMDENLMAILSCLFQNLSVDEWCSLMDKINGTPEVQFELDKLTNLKKLKKGEYNEGDLLKGLHIFRLSRAFQRS